MTDFDDGFRPHKFPASAIGEEVIAWKCQACGEWMREYGPRDQSDCPVDWRRPAALPTHD